MDGTLSGDSGGTAADRDFASEIGLMIAKFERADAAMDLAWKLESMSGHGLLGDLMRAAFLGDEAGAAEALDAGAPVDGRDGCWETALRLAARQGRDGVVRLLLERGASIDDQGWSGESALMLAASSGRASCVALLLAAGASVDLRQCDSCDGDSSKTIRVFGPVEGESWGPFQACCQHHGAQGGDQVLALAVSAWGVDSHIPRMLIAAGSELDDANANGLTALLAAASVGNLQSIEDLVDAGADLLRKDHKGRGVGELFPADRMDELRMAIGWAMSAREVRELDAGMAPGVNGVGSSRL